MSNKAELQPGTKADTLFSPCKIFASTVKTTRNAPARACLALLLVVLLLSSSALAQASAAAPNVVRLKAEAALPGPNIALGEVAEISGPNAETLGRVDLGPVPWPGTKRLIDTTVAKIKLFRDGIDLNEVTIIGEGCVVTTKTVTVPGREILEVARKLLLERLPWPSEDVNIEPEAEPEDREVAAGSGTPVLEAATAGSITSAGKVRVLVTGKADGRSLFRTTVSFQVHVFGTVIVARRRIRRGEIFTEDNIVGRRLDVTTLSMGSPCSRAELIGNKAARAISPGKPISRKMVITPPVVKRGNVVQIVFKTPFLSLSARGVAKDSAAPGEVVRVKNIDSGREVIGKAMPDGSVSVSY